MQEDWVQSLGQKDPLEKGKATHSNIRAWRIPWIEEPGELQSMDCKELDMTEQLMHKNIIIVYILKRLFKIVCIVLNSCIKNKISGYLLEVIRRWVDLVTWNRLN